jgi:SAM-dependent methyltransferase
LTGCAAGRTLTGVNGTPDHVLRNRAEWDQWAADYAEAGVRAWAAAEPSWGVWSVPEEQAGVLPPALDGADCLELGCGTGYVSAWLARRGARPVGLDNSAAQLATAAALQDRFGLRFPLIHASAEKVPCADATFDLVISEYGASNWCDPYAWIPEAARVLRPGGQLIFLVNSVQLILTLPEEEDLPATQSLQRPFFGMHRFQWLGTDSVEFHIGHGDMIRLLRRCGFEVEDLIELQPAPDATTQHPLASLEWARQWPCEEVWKARKTH